MSERPAQADLDLAHKRVCKHYSDFRAKGGTGGSPYGHFLMFQNSIREMMRRQGRAAEFDLHDMLIVRPDGRQVVVDLRHLAPAIFGDPT